MCYESVDQGTGVTGLQGVPAKRRRLPSQQGEHTTITSTTAAATTTKNLLSWSTRETERERKKEKKECRAEVYSVSAFGGVCDITSWSTHDAPRIQRRPPPTLTLLFPETSSPLSHVTWRKSLKRPSPVYNVSVLDRPRQHEHHEDTVADTDDGEQ